MKVKSSVLLGLIVLVCLLGGLSLMSRLNVEEDVWRPVDMYSAVGGTHGSTFSTVSYDGAASSGVDMPMMPQSGSAFRRRAVFSYAHTGASVNPSSIANGSSPIANSQGLYATSSAEHRSFGGGGNAAVSMSGGVVKSATSPVASTVTGVGMVNNVPTLAINRSALTQQSEMSSPQAVAAVSAVVSSSSQMYGDVSVASSMYNGIGYTTGGVGRAGMPKKAPGIGGILDDWASDHLYGDTPYFGDADGYYTEEEIKALYEQAIANGDLPPGVSWDEFKSWYKSNGYDVPVGDGFGFMMLMTLVYALYVVCRRKRQLV